MNPIQLSNEALSPSMKRDAIWRVIVNTLAGFSALQRKIFVLYHYAGSSLPSIADKTGLDENKVREIIDQTNRLLMRQLQEYRQENGGSWEGKLPDARLAAC